MLYNITREKFFSSKFENLRILPNIQYQVPKTMNTFSMVKTFAAFLVAFTADLQDTFSQTSLALVSLLIHTM